MENSIKCICCGFEIKPIFPDVTNEERTPMNVMWDGGTAVKLHMPYGSRFDDNIYVIGLCDNCIEEKEKQGLIKQI